MPPLARSQLARVVYRRILPRHWNAQRREPEPRAFVKRPDEGGLSVYQAGKQSPRRLLEMEILRRLQDENSPSPAARQSAAAWLAENGRTAELMYDRGWRIARLPLDAFPPEKGFVVGPPARDGHINIGGSEELFVDYALELLAREDVRVLTRRETLRGRSRLGSRS